MTTSSGRGRVAWRNVLMRGNRNSILVCHWSEKEFALARKLPYSIIMMARKQRSAY